MLYYDNNISSNYNKYMRFKKTSYKKVNTYYLVRPELILPYDQLYGLITLKIITFSMLFKIYGEFPIVKLYMRKI